MAFGALGTLGACKDAARLDTAGQVGPGQLPATPAPAPGAARPSPANQDGGGGPAGERRAADMSALLHQIQDATWREVAFGKLALKRGRSREVKEYGDMLVRDHGAAGEKLRAVARDNNVTLPGDEVPLSDQTKEALEALRPHSGTAFDRAFARTVVADHDKTIALLEKAQGQLRDGEVKTWMASEVLPTLRRHRERAQALSVDDGTTTSGSAAAEATKTVKGRSPSNP